MSIRLKIIGTGKAIRVAGSMLLFAWMLSSCTLFKGVFELGIVTPEGKRPQEALPVSTAFPVLTLTPTPVSNPLDPTIAPATPLPTALTSPISQDSPLFFGFLACTSPCEADGSNAVQTFQEGTKQVYLRWGYQNIPEGAQYVRRWLMNGQEWVRYECTWPGPDSGVDNLSLSEPDGLHSGIWQVTIYVDDVPVLLEHIEVEGDWAYWSPAGVFNTCYGYR